MEKIVVVLSTLIPMLTVMSIMMPTEMLMVMKIPEAVSVGALGGLMEGL